MRKFFNILISVVITLYFSATMFYCFVAGAPDGGKGAVIYMMSAAGLSILFPAFTCGCIHYILYLRKKMDEQAQMIRFYGMITINIWQGMSFQKTVI